VFSARRLRVFLQQHQFRGYRSDIIKIITNAIKTNVAFILRSCNRESDSCSSLSLRLRPRIITIGFTIVTTIVSISFLQTGHLISGVVV